jgi:hypothetical protein
MLTSMAARGHLDLDSQHALSRALAIDTRLAQLEEILGEREERCVRGDAEQYIQIAFSPRAQAGQADLRDDRGDPDRQQQEGQFTRINIIARIGAVR